MNHAPLIITKRTLSIMAIAATCQFAQAGTDGYLSTSTAAGTSAVGPTAVIGGSTAQASIDAREKARRKAKMDAALQLLQEGRTAYEAKKYKVALEKFQDAWAEIPKAPATVKWQEHIIDCIGDASIAVSMEYAKVGRYDEAEQLLLDVLSRDPKNRLAARRLEELRDPVRNNPALTPEHVKNVEEVQRLLTLGWGYYNLGDLDAAYDTFAKVLEIDKYNSAARRGQEAVSKRRMVYYESARDAFRARALAEVDATWQEALPSETADVEFGAPVAETLSPNQLRNEEMLASIPISEIVLQEVPMAEALDILRAEAKKNNLSLNFIYERPKTAAPQAAAAPAPSSDEDDVDDMDDSDDSGDSAQPAPLAQAPAEAMITSLNVSNINGKDLLELMCSDAGCQYRVEDNAIVVYQTGSGEKMIRQQWKVAPSFFKASADGSEEEVFDEDTGMGEAAPRRMDAKTVLFKAGVSFPTGADARYSETTGVLTVTNTVENIEAVENAIAAFREQMPQMVKVSTKFIEVSQTNEEELSFDWVINPFQLNSSGTAYLGGANGSNSNPIRGVADFVSGTVANYTGVNPWPISGETVSDTSNAIANGLVTGGLRSGSGALQADTLDALLASGSVAAGTTTAPAPGILSFSGIFDRGSFQMIMRGLSQKKGVDVMSAPSLVAQPGDLSWSPEPDPLSSDQGGDNSCAKIEMIRRFVYPTSYDPPQIQSNSGNNNNNNNTAGLPIAAPANPTEWQAQEIGIMMRFKVATFDEGNKDIIKFDQFEIRVTDFEGFINYGSPIYAGIANEEEIQQIMLTDNRIDMPVFSIRYVNTNPCIYDGYTIAIGGMITDNVQKVEDRVPVLGDLPLIGRLFRSNAESHIRRNLVVFVTAEKIDPTGKPTRKREKGTGDNPASTTAPSLFPDDGLARP